MPQKQGGDRPNNKKKLNEAFFGCTLQSLMAVVAGIAAVLLIHGGLSHRPPIVAAECESKQGIVSLFPHDSAVLFAV